MTEKLEKEVALFRDLAKKIREVLDVQVNLSVPSEVAEHLSQLSSLLGTASEMAAKATWFYNHARMELYDRDLVKKSDSTGFIDSHIKDEAYWKDYTENLQRGLRTAIDATRTQLSYLKNERDNV